MQTDHGTGPKLPKALADMSRRELRHLAKILAQRDDIVRRANTCGVGVNEIARITGLAKTTVIRILADVQLRERA